MNGVSEDELVVRRLMQEVICTSFGCRVDMAGDGEAAWEMLAREEYALILTDVKMPRLGGLELLARLCRERPHAARRIVFVTGQPGDKALMAAAAEMGSVVVAKPFTLEQLAAACRPLLQAPAAMMPA